jgi:putative glutamine amidotransferase
MRPLIAVTTTTSIAADFRVPQVTLGTPYIRVLEAMGGSVILLTPAHDPRSIERILDLSCGLVLTGGEDVEPRRYGEEPNPKLGATNPDRDRMELLTVDAAVQRGMPILAICRGMQLLNVAFGGTLYQDLPTDLEGDLLHEQEAPVGDGWHSARVDPASRLARIFGETELFINSFHHQAIRQLGENLRAVAWAEDDVIEAVECANAAWMFGVQWHPERGEAERHPQPGAHPDRRLVEAFVAAAVEYGEAGGQITSKASSSSSANSSSSPV